MAAAAATRVICACVRVFACVCARATISREQGPNKLSLIPNPLARGQCCGGHRYQVLRKPRARTRAHSLCLCLSLYASLSPFCLSLSLSLSLDESVGFVKSTDRTWKGKLEKETHRVQ